METDLQGMARPIWTRLCSRLGHRLVWLGGGAVLRRPSRSIPIRGCAATPHAAAGAYSTSRRRESVWSGRRFRMS